MFLMLAPAWVHLYHLSLSEYTMLKHVAAVHGYVFTVKGVVTKHGYFKKLHCFYVHYKTFLWLFIESVYSNKNSVNSEADLIGSKATNHKQP